MKILAIESSTPHGSAALIEGDQCVAECSWRERYDSGEDFFTSLPGLLESAGWMLDDVDVYAVGRGPGNYSGLRASMSSARALALPDGKPVYTISSGEVLAYDVMADHDVPAIVVAGDARRERLWFGVFLVRGGRLTKQDDWDLTPLETFEEHVPENALIVSPDWARLKEAVEGASVLTAQWMTDDCSPTAARLGLLTADRLARDIASEPLTPIYTHPPVFVKPSFPAG
jgi:tRNA threonylcarbamoyl adenosine modification protein YeaZ